MCFYRFFSYTENFKSSLEKVKSFLKNFKAFLEKVKYFFETSS